MIATATNVLAQGDLYANQAALPARWRPRARWMMNLSIINGYRQLPQATGLNYSIINDDGPRPRALGWTVYENSSMDGSLGAGADYTVLSGDFRQYIIVAGSAPPSSWCRTFSARTAARPENVAFFCIGGPVATW